MGCKNGPEKEDKNEIQKSVIDILKEEEDEDATKDIRYDLDYYQKKFAEEEQQELTKYNS